MSSQTNAIHCDNFCHIAKGTGYFFGSCGASLALVVLATAVTATALALILGDALFLYSMAMKGSMHLIWAVPVALLFVAVDLVVIYSLSKVSVGFGNTILHGIQHCGNKMLDHHKAVKIS